MHHTDQNRCFKVRLRFHAIAVFLLGDALSLARGARILLLVVDFLRYSSHNRLVSEGRVQTPRLHCAAQISRSWSPPRTVSREKTRECHGRLLANQGIGPSKSGAALWAFTMLRLGPRLCTYSRKMHRK